MIVNKRTSSHGDTPSPLKSSAQRKECEESYSPESYNPDSLRRGFNVASRDIEGDKS